MTTEKKKSWLSFKMLFFIIFVFVLVERMQKRESKSMSPINEKVQTASNAVQTKEPSGSVDLPLKHEVLADAMDAITGIENLRIILSRKNPSRLEIYQYVENNYETVGVQCRHEACLNLRFSMDALKKFAKNPTDLEAITEAGNYLKIAAKETAVLKSHPAYKLLKKKPMFISDGVYVIESEIRDRNDCKLLGDTIHRSKKQTPIAFIKPGAKVSKKLEGPDLAFVNCIYRYNYGGRNITQTLLNSEIVGRWP